MTHLRRSVSAAVLAATLVAASCGDDSATAPATSTTTAAVSSTTATSTSTTTSTTSTVAPDPRAGRPYVVSTTQLTLVDPSRSTPESPDGPGSDDRTLEVWVHLPETTDPAPLIVFSHGMAGHPRKFEDLHAAWAAAGYAVAAPAFPLSNDGATGSFTNTHDVPNQPGDVAFVLSELLARSADASSELAGRFDPDLVGASGLSAGGFTTYEVAVNAATRDPRVDAAIVMAGAADRDSGLFAPADDVPVLVFQGDLDPLIGVAEAGGQL